MQLSEQFEEHSHIADQVSQAATDAANDRMTFSHRVATEAAARRGETWASHALGDYGDDY